MAAAPANAQPWQIYAGKWKLVRSENFEAFLEEMKVNAILRKLIKDSKGKAEVKIDGDKITIIFKLGLKKITNTFHVNGPEHDIKFDGKTVKAKTTWEDGKLIVVNQPSADGEIKAQKVTREIVNDEMVMTMECGNVVCKRWAKRYISKKK